MEILKRRRQALTIGQQMKGPMSRMVTTSGVGDHWGPTDPQTFQAIANVLSYHPETDGKTVLTVLKRPPT